MTSERNSLLLLPLHNDPDVLLCPEVTGAFLAYPWRSYVIKKLEGKGTEMEKFDLCGEKEELGSLCPDFPFSGKKKQKFQITWETGEGRSTVRERKGPKEKEVRIKMHEGREDISSKQTTSL